MQKIDYTAFDAELLAQIKAGLNRMMLLEEHQPLIDMAKPIAAASMAPFGTPEWRIIDRRLQALRKKGDIQHDGKVWKIVEKGGA